MMIVAFVLLLGLFSWTVVIATGLVHDANQRADDADARRFRALELLNEEQVAHARDREQWDARLSLMDEANAAREQEVKQFRARVEGLERLAKELSGDVPDPPKPTRVM